MNDQENKALYIAEQCRKAGMTLAGAAGVLINMEAESLISETNVEDRYHRDTGKTDADYTRLVDTNPGYDFISDNGKHYGYGLCQWTLGSRKKELREFCRTRGVSIGDFRTQVDFFIQECRRDFLSVWSILCSSNDPGQCAWQVCRWFENPDNAEGQANNRAANAGKWYNFLVANADAESSIPESDPAPPSGEDTNVSGKTDDDGIPIAETWPPRTLHKGRCSGWKEIRLLQSLLDCHGYNVLSNGIFDEVLEKKVIEYQKDRFPYQPSEWDGIVGNKTWTVLGVNMKS